MKDWSRGGQSGRIPCWMFVIWSLVRIPIRVFVGYMNIGLMQRAILCWCMWMSGCVSETIGKEENYGKVFFCNLLSELKDKRMNSGRERETKRRWTINHRKQNCGNPGLSSQSTGHKSGYKAKERITYLVRFFFCISFFSAAPSNGFNNSNAHSKSSETLITAPKLSNSTIAKISSIRLFFLHVRWEKGVTSTIVWCWKNSDQCPFVPEFIAIFNDHVSSAYQIKIVSIDETQDKSN